MGVTARKNEIATDGTSRFTVSPDSRQGYRNYWALHVTREVTGCTTSKLFLSGIYGNCQNRQPEASDLDESAVRLRGGSSKQGLALAKRRSWPLSFQDFKIVVIRLRAAGMLPSTIYLSCSTPFLKFVEGSGSEAFF